MLYNVALVSAIKQCESALCDHISPLHPPPACCSPRGRKESDRTGQLNNSNKSPPSQTSLPALLPSHPSRSSQTTWLSSLCYAHGCVYMSGLPSQGFSGGTSGKEPTCQPRRRERCRSGGSSGGGHGNPLQYPCLKNPMDRGACGLQSMRSQRVGYDRSDLAPTTQLSVRPTLFFPSWVHESVLYVGILLKVDILKSSMRRY